MRVHEGGFGQVHLVHMWLLLVLQRAWIALFIAERYVCAGPGQCNNADVNWAKRALRSDTFKWLIEAAFSNCDK